MLFNMLINKDNIEAYLLDYMEGNLDPADENALNAFLKAHPEYAELLDGQPMPVLRPDKSIVYGDKDSLKRKTPARIFYLNRTVVRLAAAAAVLALIISIAIPFLRSPEQDPQVIRAHADRPGIVIDTQHIAPQEVEDPEVNETNRQQDEQKQDQKPEPRKQPKQYAPIIPVNPPQDQIASNQMVLPERLSRKAVGELKLESYTSDHQRMQADLLASAQPLLPEQENQNEQKRNGFFNTILNSEVARNFLPEAVQQSLPEPDEADKKDNGGKNLILELPPAGKRLIDTFFKTEE